jgi:hypothetical protein
VIRAFAGIFIWRKKNRQEYIRVLTNAFNAINIWIKRSSAKGQSSPNAG